MIFYHVHTLLQFKCEVEEIYKFVGVWLVRVFDGPHHYVQDAAEKRAIIKNNN